MSPVSPHPTPSGEPAPGPDIEALAAAFLASVPGYIWDGQSLPVPIEDIADSHLGLLVRDVEDLRLAPGAPRLDTDQALSGLLLPDRGEIWVNAEEGRLWPPRRRFTIAHEIGHWQLHRTGHGSVFCRSTAIEPDPTSAPAPLTPAEEQANAFAAALLMPPQLLQRQYEATGRDFARLCRTFGSSGAAMGRRLHTVIPRS